MCYLLALLRIHHPGCELCNPPETCGDEIRKRLDELNWRTQPHPLNSRDHEEVVADSEPGAINSTPVSSKARKKSA